MTAYRDADGFDVLLDQLAETTIGTGSLTGLDRDQYWRGHLSSSPAPRLPAENGLAWHWAPATAHPPARGDLLRERSPAPHSAPTSTRE